MGNDYYPRPGFEDFVGSVDSKEEVDGFMIDFAIEKKSGYDWAQIVDCKTSQIVREINQFEKFFEENKNVISLKLNKKVVKI